MKDSASHYLSIVLFAQESRHPALSLAASPKLIAPTKSACIMRTRIVVQRTKAGRYAPRQGTDRKGGPMKFNDRDDIIQLTPLWYGERFADGRPVCRTTFCAA